MKKMRKGFTLVELLIVLAILGGLSAMMATSSTEAIDASAASSILNNLQTMKTAAFEMYMENPTAASLATVALDGTDAVGESTVKAVLGGYLGRHDLATNYGLVGSGKHWYVVYTLTTKDSTGVKASLAASANAAGLYGQKDAPDTTNDNCGFAAYYANKADADAEVYIALMVR